jgi:hypothetical protein
MQPARRPGAMPDLFPWLPDAGGECRAPSPERRPRGGGARPAADNAADEWESLWIDLGGEG